MMTQFMAGFHAAISNYTFGFIAGLFMVAVAIGAAVTLFGVFLAFVKWLFGFGR